MDSLQNLNGKRNTPQNSPNSTRHGNPVIATNDDAANAKSFCVEKGYYKDQFIKYFVKTSSKGSRPMPLINRGYWSRVAAFRGLIEKFLKNESQPQQRKQIISLGAGFDTSIFHYKSENIAKDNHFFYEVDLPEVVQNKISIIARHQQLRELVTQDWDKHFHADKTEIHALNYHLMSVDLNLKERLQQSLTEAGIDFTAPTLVLSECVLIYLKSSSSNAIIKWISEAFSVCSFCNYEQVRPNDPFGSVMVDNLEKRGCALLGIRDYPDLESQNQRLHALGWSFVEIVDMYDVYNKILEKKEVARIQAIEFFDEYEEWRLIQQHYCMCWASQDKTAQKDEENFWLQNKIKLL